MYNALFSISYPFKYLFNHSRRSRSRLRYPSHLQSLLHSSASCSCAKYGYFATPGSVAVLHCACEAYRATLSSFASG